MREGNSKQLSRYNRLSLSLSQSLVFEEVHLTISSSLEWTFEAVQRRSINVFLRETNYSNIFSSLREKVESSIIATMFLFQFPVVTSGCVVFDSAEEKNHDVAELPFVILNISIRSALLRLSFRVHRRKWFSHCSYGKFLRSVNIRVKKAVLISFK